MPCYSTKSEINAKIISNGVKQSEVSHFQLKETISSLLHYPPREEFLEDTKQNIGMIKTSVCLYHQVAAAYSLTVCNVYARACGSSLFHRGDGIGFLRHVI